jgi:hypothetical protein
MKERVEFFQILLHCSEAIAVLAGTIIWVSLTDKRIKAFILYLLFILICDVLGWYFKNYHYKTANVALYNYLVMPVEFLFNIWVLYSYMPNKKLKHLCIVFSSIVIISRVIELGFLKDERFFFSSLSYVISSLLLLIIILLFLLQFIKSDKLLQYDRHFDFWIAIALLIFYLGSFPLWTFYNYLNNTNKTLFFTYWQIMMCLNITMYLLFATALLWTNLKYKYLLR